MVWLGYWLFYLFPLATVVGTSWGGAWAFLSPLLAGLAVPVLDLVFGDDTANPSDGAEQRLKGERRWRAVLYLFVPVQWGLLLWACAYANHTASPVAWLALALSVGVVNGGLSINVAHELCHRLKPLDQAAARALWLSVGYLHFHLEHRLGHHRRVATREDPATARRGEPVYTFYRRSIAGGFASAWAIERTRLWEAGLPVLSVRNQMLWSVGLTLGCVAALWGALGARSAGFYVLQAAIAILVLETVNYIEHYGLERTLVAPGVYEPVGLQHSWNSSRRLTNYLLLKLQRHSDHHANPERRYQILRAFEGSPQLPLGYGGMVLLALVPPLWHRIMDPRVEACRASVVRPVEADYAVTS
ncbi:MAG: alkB [Cyanobacteria bacterium RYN_339]|nr:alkB [Cyanobacteria bacterium RYN_339]